MKIRRIRPILAKQTIAMLRLEQCKKFYAPVYSPGEFVFKSNPMLNKFTQLLTPNTCSMNPMSSSQPVNFIKKYAIIIPCYNEEKRLPFKRFLSFAVKHPEVLLCFVNDGSKDNTIQCLF